jgi:hypothetical protein
MKHIAIALILIGCAKTPTETITETALNQTETIYQQIKKQCPEAKIDDQIAILKQIIKTQLATCETEQDKLKERNNTLWAVIIGIIAIFFIKQRWFK